MRYRASALALLAIGGTAAAQVPPAQPDPFAPQPPPEPPTEPAPPPAPTPPTPPVVPAPPPAPAPQPTATGHRPTALSFGIGFGYQFPTSLQTPNLTSIRFRLASGLTFEPRLVLASSSQDVDTGPSVTNSATQFGLGALARYPLAGRGRVDLELLGGLDLNRQSTNPDSEESDLSVTAFTAVYGLAVGAWITPHWQVSLSAVNPLISYVRRDEQMGPGTSTVTTTQTISLVLDPTVSLMVHLYH